jgi:hypothetical protein
VFLASIHEIIHRSLYSLLFFVTLPIFTGHNGTWIHAKVLYDWSDAWGSYEDGLQQTDCGINWYETDAK